MPDIPVDGNGCFYVTQDLGAAFNYDSASSTKQNAFLHLPGQEFSEPRDPAIGLCGTSAQWDSCAREPGNIGNTFELVPDRFAYPL